MVELSDADRADAAARARAKARLAPEGPDTVFGRAHVAGSVDLIHAANQPEWQFQGARICDVVRTIDGASESLVLATVEHFDKKFVRLNKTIAGLDARLAAVDERSARIELENVALKDEVSDLAARLKRVSASRGGGDGASLPAPLTRPQARARRARPSGKAAAGEARP